MTHSAFVVALLGRCPRCGKGKLFSGVLDIVSKCAHCQLSLKAQDSGDGPVFFALVIIGFLSVGLAAYTEIKYAPPWWVHAILWIPFTVIGCILCMRFFKGLLIALQFRHNPDSFKDK